MAELRFFFDLSDYLCSMNRIYAPVAHLLTDLSANIVR
jgi:hypothetical protein